MACGLPQPAKTVIIPHIDGVLSKTHGAQNKDPMHSASADRNCKVGTAVVAVMLTHLMPCLNLFWLAFLLSRHSGNLDLVQLVVEILIEAEHISLTDILAHGILLQNIAPLHQRSRD